MIETLLKSIDGRLQKLSDDVGEMKVTVASMSIRLDGVERRLDTLEHRFDGMDRRQDRMETALSLLTLDVHRIPTWKGIGAAATGVVAASGGFMAWMAAGGAETLAKVFTYTS